MVRVAGSAVVLALVLSVVAVPAAHAEHQMMLHEAGFGEPGPFPEICVDPQTAVEHESAYGTYTADPERFEKLWVGRDGAVHTSGPVEGFDPDRVPVRVLLPPGYHDEPERRYPVLYFYTGSVGDADYWFAVPHEWPIHCFSAEREPVIWVFPDSPGLDVDYRDGSHLWETFHVRTLVEVVDTRYRTLADRAHRAVSGISKGGLAAMTYAARNPEVFVAAASFSGPLDGRSDVNALGWTGLSVVGLCVIGFWTACPDQPYGEHGDPVTDMVWWRDHNPVDLAPNLRGARVYAGAGNGVPCTDDEDYDPTYDVVHNVQYTPGVAVGEAAISRRDTEAFGEAAARAAVDLHLDLPDCGGHDLPLYWRQLHNFWPTLIDAFGTPPPDDFDHGRADPEFTVWDWTFAADPDRAPEFLDIRNASHEGLVLTGSGTTTVTTATYFEADQEIRVTVALDDTTLEELVVQATDGRLTFTVDLGPPHEHQQYTPQQRALEAAEGPDYWQTRTVSFMPGTGE